MEMTVRDWFEQRSFHYRDFGRLAVSGPAARDTWARTHPAVTLILPAREVAATIGPILDTVARLNEQSGLIDQVLVVDADSADGTAATSSCSPTLTPAISASISSTARSARC
jgi:glucosyl-3-phosphoglycerate synthase